MATDKADTAPDLLELILTPVTCATQVAFLQLPGLHQAFSPWILAPSVSLLPTPHAEINPNSNATSPGTPSLVFPIALSFLPPSSCDHTGCLHISWGGGCIGLL